MSVFVDTGVFVAFENTSDPNHETARRLLMAAAARRFGNVLTSDYILDEAVTLALARARRRDAAVSVGNLILGTGPLGRFSGLVYVSPRVFLRSWSRFQRLASRGLSFTDCTSLEVMRTMAIEEIVSFDRDFDGLAVRRDTTD